MLKGIHLAGKVLSYGSSYSLSKGVRKNICFNTLNQQVLSLSYYGSRTPELKVSPAPICHDIRKPHKWARVFTTKGKEAWKLLRSMIWVQFYWPSILGVHMEPETPLVLQGACHMGSRSSGEVREPQEHRTKLSSWGMASVLLAPSLGCRTAELKQIPGSSMASVQKATGCSVL